MYRNQYPQNPANLPLDNRYRVAPSVGAAAFGGLIAGLVTGATLATARSIKKVRQGKITKKQAGAEILHDASILGLATTAGVTATALLNLRGVASIAGVALVTAGTKYCLDSLYSEDEEDNKKEILQN